MSTLEATKVTEIQKVANRLVALCREGKNLDAINELYDDNIVSLEPKGSRHERTEGKAGVIANNQEMFQTVEQMFSTTISEPIIGGNFFSCVMEMDVKMKGMDRMNMSEICVYEVKNDKIVFEQFFFTMGN
jgi:ketosteroid isomerase-like protein